jgi:signal peptidase II
MQAARGTAVAAPAPPRSQRRSLALLGLVLALAYATDQVSKAVAVARLEGAEDVHVVGDLLQLHLTRNPGAAFSAGTDYTPLLTLLAMTATVVVLWVARRVRSTAWAVTFGLLLAGITGNLTDRLVRDPEPFHGHVIDFLMLPNWPIFNVADICINVAAALVLLLTFRGVHLDGTRHRRHDGADEADEADGDPA